MKVVLTHFYAAPWCDMMMIAAQQMTSFIPLFDALVMTTATMMMLMLKSMMMMVMVKMLMMLVMGKLCHRMNWPLMPLMTPLFLSDPGVPGPIFVSGCPSVCPSLTHLVET